jgi:hypothetical protein
MLNKVLDPLACNTYASLTGETVLLPSIEMSILHKDNLFHTVKA